MVWFKEKNAGDAKASARLFDAKTGHLAPTLSGSAQFHHFGVEISSFAGSKQRQFRLKLKQLGCCAIKFPIESRP